MHGGTSDVKLRSAVAKEVRTVMLKSDTSSYVKKIND